MGFASRRGFLVPGRAAGASMPEIFADWRCHCNDQFDKLHTDHRLNPREDRLPRVPLGNRIVHEAPARILCASL